MKKIILLTGATSGIGYEAARAFAKAGHTLIFIARSKEKAEKVKNALTVESSNNDIYYLLADFSDLGQVKNAALQVMKDFSHIDILVNNAGVWEMERKESANGVEMNFAVNHLAPFLLTLLLIPHLRKAKKARIVNTSSMAHRRNILELSDIEFKNQPYDGVSTYSQSKLCNLLFSLQLSKELANSDIIVHSVHPGYVQTDLFENMGARNWGNAGTAADGARSTIYAALSPEVENKQAKYYYHESEEEPTATAKNEKLAKALWDLSLKYVSAFYPIN